MGESTPLLAQCRGDDDGILAPPPSDAPPLPPAPTEAPPSLPPPSLENDVADSSYQKGGNGDDIIDAKKQPKPFKDKDDEVESQTGLSTKSGSRKKGKKKGEKSSKSSATITSAVATSSKTKTDTKKSKQAQKKKLFDGPRKSPCHLLFDFIRYMAILASFMMLLMQIIPLILNDSNNNDNESTVSKNASKRSSDSSDEINAQILQFIIRIYLLLFCIYFILLELQIPLLQSLLFSRTNGNSLYSNWILRGFLYTFIGVIGMEQDIAVRATDYATSSSRASASILGPDYGSMFASLFVDITTWVMVSVGILYVALGVLCMQSIYEKMLKDYRGKMEEWKRKKREEKNWKKEKEEYKQYEEERREGRAEWYDDLES